MKCSGDLFNSFFFLLLVHIAPVCLTVMINSNHPEYVNTNSTDSLLDSGSSFVGESDTPVDIVYDIIGDIEKVAQISLTVDNVDRITIMATDGNGTIFTKVTVFWIGVDLLSDTH